MAEGRIDCSMQEEVGRNSTPFWEGEVRSSGSEPRPEEGEPWLAALGVAVAEARKREEEERSETLPTEVVRRRTEVVVRESCSNLDSEAEEVLLGRVDFRRHRRHSRELRACSGTDS